MRNRLSFIFIFLFACLSGCSNYKELNGISIVVGLGIDYNPSKDLYEVVYQSINPSENTAQGAGSGATPIVTYKTTGKTLSEAAMNTSNVISRQNIYSHIELVIIGEKLAKKESLNFIFDVFERNASSRVNVPVLMARNSDVKTIMDILPSNDKIPVRTILGKIKNASDSLGEHGIIKIYEIIENLTGLGSEVAISGISVLGNKETGTTKANLETMRKTYVKLDGMAVFRRGKFVGWVDGKKTKSLQIIKNKIKKTNLRIHCNKKRYNSVMVNRLNSDSNVDIKNNQVVITIKTNTYGYISELLCNKDISKKKIKKEYERKAERELEKEIKEGIVAAQKMKSDVFGFGEILHYKHLSKWNKSKHHWDELFSQAKVNVHVHMDIEGTGMRIKPYPY
ncbi:Ger(x)C family spore germination protein [Neobacillus drentensis]|uniref:Ger(x)C family spore germination protein n=1 Tax=Neobacillus drentensis TaxID=220684 RepID=UPI002FFDFC9C